MLWKHMPLGDHLAFEQLLISANLHSPGFLASLLNSGHLVLGFLLQVFFNFRKQFSSHYRRDHPGTIILQGEQNGDKLEMHLILIHLTCPG